MPEQSTPLSGMTGAAVDIGDVREGEQGGAAFEPKSCPIESEKIPITTIYRPDLMPDRVEGSIAPVVEYDMTSVPVSLPKPPSDRQRKFSRQRMGAISANQLEYLKIALDSKPTGARESFLRPETYDACQPIKDANRAFLSPDRASRSIGGAEITCSRLTADEARDIPQDAVPDTAMVDLVRRLMFRALTQAKENPPLPPNPTRAEQNDHDKGVPVYSYHDKSGIVPFGMIPQYMEREKQIMKANTSEKEEWQDSSPVFHCPRRL